jgi:hypothetical protein
MKKLHPITILVDPHKDTTLTIQSFAQAMATQIDQARQEHKFVSLTATPTSQNADGDGCIDAVPE